MWYTTFDKEVHGIIELGKKLVHLYKKRVRTSHENFSDIKYYKLLYGGCAIHHSPPYVIKQKLIKISMGPFYG